MTRLPELVSVLVPLYNHESFVAACLDSIAEQDYARLELLVVDDGSTDSSAAVVDEWLAHHASEFERVEFVRRENRGVLATLTELVEMAHGEILVPIASDDELMPGAVSRRVGLLRRRPDQLALVTDCAVIDEHGAVRHTSGVRDLHGGHVRALQFEPGLVATLLLRWAFPGPCITLRRAAFDRTVGVGPYSDLTFPEDFDLYVRLAVRRALWFVPETTARYRVHSSNISLALPDLMQSGNRRAIQRVEAHLRPVDRIIARTILVATTNGRFTTPARASLWMARRIWPVIAGALVAVGIGTERAETR